MNNLITANIQNALLGVYSASPKLLQERNEVLKYYCFYNGKAKSENDVMNEFTRGQSWEVPAGLDFTPSQDIRNHTKKLIQKQGRFMFGVEPDVLLKPMKKGDKDAAEGKRTFIDQVLTASEFWNETFKAFIDSTIGKRVLLTVAANPNEPIQFRYYTMEEFTYKTDPDDYKKLTEVIIAYMDEDSENKAAEYQVWHRWRYYMNPETGTAFLEQGDYDGNGKLIAGTEQIFDTKLDELPCKVIINGGLLGETDGTSDVNDLMELAVAYNKTLSDFRDALRFKMFEQPVFTDVDPKSLANAKIAPNSMLHLATDPAAAGTAKANAFMLSSTFNFKEAAEYFLDRTIGDMYEIMDQPRPDDIKNVPSAKAMRFIFYDLIARCEEKWKSWEPAIKWVVDFTIKATEQFSLYAGEPNREYIDTETVTVLKHNYPIPEDDEIKRKTALAEVAGRTKSIKTYIREHGDVIDEDGEFNEIIEEIKQLTAAEGDPFTTQVDDELGGEGGENFNKSNNKDDNQGGDKSKTKGGKNGKYEGQQNRGKKYEGQGGGE